MPPVSRLRALAALALLLMPALLMVGISLSGMTATAVAAPPSGPATPAPTTTALIARPQIVGGEPAQAGELPWQVALVNVGSQFCGGTILDARWVLTAAHCVDGLPQLYPGISVMAGSLTLNPPGSAAQISTVRRVIMHERYNAMIYDNDIALLRLETPLTFNADVQPIALIDAATIAHTGAGAPALVSGWGALSELRPGPNALQQVIVPIVDQQVCSTAYSGGITANMLCAGYLEGGRDSCYGDSGGPLVVPVGSDWRLAGIVSWGEGCARPDFPGVYTRVSRYLSWIAGYVTAVVPTAGPAPTAVATATLGPTAVPTVPPPTAEPLLNTLANGGFEDDLNLAWSEASSLADPLIVSDDPSGGVTPYEGQQMAMLGGSDMESAALTQAFMTGDLGGMVSFRYQVRSTAFCSGSIYGSGDEAEVTLEVLGPAQEGGPLDAAPAQLSTSTLCLQSATDRWLVQRVSLHEYPHAIVKLGFLLTSDFSEPSVWYLDDVRYQPYTTRLFLPQVTR